MTETFWSDDNILFLGLDGGYRGVHTAVDDWAEHSFYVLFCMHVF